VSGWLGAGTVGTTLGFGDAPNDLPLLQAVDEPVIVPRPDGTPHPDLVTALPHARVAPAPGPAGWNEVVLDWLLRGPQPRLGETRPT
jgi:predicted mannosyl-3-phosphoglycerate phosphatase (HAD superfamily)